MPPSISQSNWPLWMPMPRVQNKNMSFFLPPHDPFTATTLAVFWWDWAWTASRGSISRIFLGFLWNGQAAHSGACDRQQSGRVSAIFWSGKGPSRRRWHRCLAGPRKGVGDHLGTWGGGLHGRRSCGLEVVGGLRQGFYSWKVGCLQFGLSPRTLSS